MNKVDVPYLDIEGVTVPTYGTDGAAGFDLYAAEDGVVLADTIVGLKPDPESEPVEGFDLPLIECSPFDKACCKLKIKKFPVQVSTKLHIAIPEGLKVTIPPRSGMGFKNGIATHIGTIDEDYRGELKVLLYNHSENDFHFKKGDRIAQGVLEPYVKANFVPTDKLPETVRGDGGLGHTGK